MRRHIRSDWPHAMGSSRGGGAVYEQHDTPTRRDEGKMEGRFDRNGQVRAPLLPTSLGNSPILTFIQLAPHGPQDGKIGHGVRPSAH